jgi:hypothetical protein
MHDVPTMTMEQSLMPTENITHISAHRLVSMNLFVVFLVIKPLPGKVPFK